MLSFVMAPRDKSNSSDVLMSWIITVSVSVSAIGTDVPYLDVHRRNRTLDMLNVGHVSLTKLVQIKMFKTITLKLFILYIYYESYLFSCAVDDFSLFFSPFPDSR